MKTSGVEHVVGDLSLQGPSITINIEGPLAQQIMEIGGE